MLEIGNGFFKVKEKLRGFLFWDYLVMGYLSFQIPKSKKPPLPMIMYDILPLFVISDLRLRYNHRIPVLWEFEIGRQTSLSVSRK